MQHSSANSTKGKFSLPFNVDFTTNNGQNSQTVCNTNMCLLPNGPSIPSRPVFPSALPAEYRPSTTSIDTNYLNVKKIGCICNLRCNSLTVDNGGINNSINIQFRNLPMANNNQEVTTLVVDSEGNLFQAADDTEIVKSRTTSNSRPIQKVFRRPQNTVNYETDDSNQFIHNEWASNN